MADIETIKIRTTRPIPEGVELVVARPEKGEGIVYGMLDGEGIVVASVEARMPPTMTVDSSKQSTEGSR
jgi:hypothetical protein